jgi:hypothetical protein
MGTVSIEKVKFVGIDAKGNTLEANNITEISYDINEGIYYIKNTPVIEVRVVLK